MITITITDKMTHKLNSFSDDIWEIADIHRYGRKTDWTKQTKFIQAYENKNLVGLLELTIEAGIMHIADLVVDYPHHNQHIGTTLMQKAEALAQKEKVHKIFLEAGIDWDVRKFYEKLGYKKTGDLPDHFDHQDYVIYTKFL